MISSAIKEWLIPEGKVVKVMSADLVIWELASKLPSIYQEVQYLRAENNTATYIDLGFSYDTKAKILMDYHIVNNDVTSYPFGAAENSGKLRCLLSSPYAGESHLYGSYSGGFMQTNISNAVGMDTTLEMIFEPGNLTLTNITTGATNTNTNLISYTMSANLLLFAQNYNGSVRYGGIRRIGKFQYYDKNDKLICDLVPCYRIADNVRGMYDLVRKIFLTNAGTGADFTKGPNVVDLTGIINWVERSTEEDGKTIYNGGLGYKSGYRVRSGGTEVEAVDSACTGFIPVKPGDFVELTGWDFSVAQATNCINVYDSTFTNQGQFTTQPAYYGIITSEYGFSSVTEVKTGVWRWVVPPLSQIAYIRVTGYAKNNDYVGQSMFITVNQEFPG